MSAPPRCARARCFLPFASRNENRDSILPSFHINNLVDHDHPHITEGGACALLTTSVFS